MVIWMTSNVIQIRMPKKLAEDIAELVEEGFYKNRSEVIIDAVRHFLGSDKKSDIACFIEGQLIGKSERASYSEKELDELWKKLRKGEEWKKRFGESPEEVMTVLRVRR